MNEADKIKKIFSQNLAYYMDKYELTQVEISKIAGVSQQSVSNWLNAKIAPRMGVVEKLATYFDIWKTDLLDEKSVKKKIIDASESVFSKKLKSARLKRGITKEALADLHNNTYETFWTSEDITDLETSKIGPSMDLVSNLATLLNVPKDYLLTDEEYDSFIVSHELNNIINKLSLDEKKEVATFVKYLMSRREG